MIARLNVGDWGTVLKCAFVDSNGAPIDISTASYIGLTLISPVSKTVSLKLMTLFTGGKDGLAQYTTQQGDIVEAGQYQLQGYVVTPSGAWKTTIVHLNAEATL